jgi:hypothetical protein
MLLRRLPWVCVAVLAAVALESGEETEKDTEPKRAPVTLGIQRESQPPSPSTSSDKVKLSPETPFSDARIGVAFTLPEGFSKLSDDEFRANMTRLSEYVGKEAAERVQRQAPLCFRGTSTDGRMPPAMSFSIYGGKIRYEASKLDDYRDQIRAGLERGNVRHGTLDLKLVRVGDIDALRVDYEMQSAEDNSRQKQLTLLIPGPDRFCDVGITYLKGQEETVERALVKVISTFRFFQSNTAGASGGKDWNRIFMWTGGAFLFGVVLSFALRALSGKGKSEEKQAA